MSSATTPATGSPATNPIVTGAATVPTESTPANGLPPTNPIPGSLTSPNVTTPATEPTRIVVIDGINHPIRLTTWTRWEDLVHEVGEEIPDLSIEEMEMWLGSPPSAVARLLKYLNEGFRIQKVKSGLLGLVGGQKRPRESQDSADPREDLRRSVHGGSLTDAFEGAVLASNGNVPPASNQVHPLPALLGQAFNPTVTATLPATVPASTLPTTGMTHEALWVLWCDRTRADIPRAHLQALESLLPGESTMGNSPEAVQDRALRREVGQLAWAWPGVAIMLSLQFGERFELGTAPIALQERKAEIQSLRNISNQLSRDKLVEYNPINMAHVAEFILHYLYEETYGRELTVEVKKAAAIKQRDVVMGLTSLHLRRALDAARVGHAPAPHVAITRRQNTVQQTGGAGNGGRQQNRNHGGYQQRRYNPAAQPQRPTQAPPANAAAPPPATATRAAAPPTYGQTG